MELVSLSAVDQERRKARPKHGSQASPIRGTRGRPQRCWFIAEYLAAILGRD
jgi:hypothetical protein